MKNFIFIVLLLSVSLFANAENNQINDTPKVECLTEAGTGGSIVFKGVLDYYETQSGAVIITCDPPFFQACFTFTWVWTLNGSLERKVVLNDYGATEIIVTSDATTITNPDGSKSHSFTTPTN